MHGALLFMRHSRLPTEEMHVPHTARRKMLAARASDESDLLPTRTLLRKKPKQESPRTGTASTANLVLSRTSQMHRLLLD